MKRKTFLFQSLGLLGWTSSPISCSPKHKIKGSIVGANAQQGHKLRGTYQHQPSKKTSSQIVIIGAGISGLSAARALQKNGIKDIVILDLEDHAGGNASSGSNRISPYPWGAHYVPIPNPDLREYLEFLEECGAISHYEGNLPVYNDYHLCFDPEERLYLNGRWQEGLIPSFGLGPKEQEEIKAFLDKMEIYRRAIGKDGRHAFSIPVDRSSNDPEFRKLDNITMRSWMEQEGFHSRHLHDYVNYCTRDDFGTPHDKVSAWAGIHYFAGRKGNAANATHSDVLTWPEGNGYLVNHLLKTCHGFLKLNSLATKVTIQNEKVYIDYLDTRSNETGQIEANYCIMAIPQFIAGRLLQDGNRIQMANQTISYAPWMVANLLVNTLEERSGHPMSWDNVISGSESLGYVVANHQQVQQGGPKKNITYYLPLTQRDPATERKQALSKTHEEWTTQVLEDLESVHPNIRSATEEINIMIWGHAMAQPLPGYIFGPERKQLAKSPFQQLEFAHTDLAGISIFEEAFYQGINAAASILKRIKSI